MGGDDEIVYYYQDVSLICLQRAAPHAAPIRCSLASSVCWSNGLVTYSSAPAPLPWQMLSVSPFEVQNTTFGVTPPSIMRSAVTNSTPLITGISQSSRIRSGIATLQR